MPEHRREQQQPEQQLKYDEQVFALVPRPRQVPYRRQRQRTPIITLQVSLHVVRTFRVTVHPVFRTETVVFKYDVEQTPVPVEYN